VACLGSTSAVAEGRPGTIGTDSAAINALEEVNNATTGSFGLATPSMGSSWTNPRPDLPWK